MLGSTSKYSIIAIVTLFWQLTYLSNISIGFVHDDLPKKVLRIVKKQYGKSAKAYLVEDLKSMNIDVFRIDNEAKSKAFVILKKAKGCRIGGCSSEYLDTETNYYDTISEYESFDYYFILDEKLTISKIGIYDYPGDYGFEINSPWWLKQFVGYKGAAMTYGTDIDVITGATISGNSLCNDLPITYQIAIQVLKDYKLI